jgi:hypothetical protein
LRPVGFGGGLGCPEGAPASLALGIRDAGGLIRSSFEMDVALELALEVSVMVEIDSPYVDKRTANVDDGSAS